METKIKVSLRAAKARLNRKLAKQEQKLCFLRKPIDGNGNFGIIDTSNNTLTAYGDIEALKQWMAEEKVIKPYETLTI
jgi:hypothetical protein